MNENSVLGWGGRRFHKWKCSFWLLLSRRWIRIVSAQESFISTDKRVEPLYYLLQVVAKALHVLRLEFKI